MFVSSAMSLSSDFAAVSPVNLRGLAHLDDGVDTPEACGAELLQPWSDDAASEDTLDVRLAQLSRLDLQARLVLGRITAEMLRRRVHLDLGFVRLNDYSCERLGICAGEMRALARVARGIETLPAVKTALEAGDLNWTKLRTICAVAQPCNERMWLSLARRCTAEGLRRLAQRSCKSDVLEQLVHAHEEDARAAPRDFSLPIDRIPELSRVSVEILASDPAAEFVHTTPDADPDPDTIEGEPTAIFRLRCPRSVLRLWRRVEELASRMSGQELAPWQVADAVAAEASSAVHPSAAFLNAGESDAGKHEARDTVERHASSARHCGQRCELPNFVTDATFDRVHAGSSDSQLSASRLELDREVAGLALNIEAARPAELDRRARFVLGAMQRTECQIGRFLTVVSTAKLYQAYGYSSLSLYVTNRLGFCLRKARALIALDRRSRSAAPRLAAAYRDGEISCCRALLLMPVISESNASQWIERAQQVTFARLRAEVNWAREQIEGRLFETDAVRCVFPPPRGADLDKVQIGDASLHEKMQIGNASLHQPDRAAREETKADDVVLSAVVTFRAPLSVVASFQTAIDAFSIAPEPYWRAFARLLQHVAAEWEAQPRHRDPIFERDRWRCTVPACTSRRNLHDHHVIFRSRGGDNQLENRTAVCLAHHQRDIHTGVLRAERLATGAIEWWLGVGEGLDSRAFLRFINDEYLEPPTAIPGLIPELPDRRQGFSNGRGLPPAGESRATAHA